ncbi:MAG: hypothetical protein WDN49_23215 [Acetobacteraceae bacterium]
MLSIGRCLLVAAFVVAATPAMAQHWATVWTAGVQGPYPSGRASAQPDLAAAFANPQTGSHEQTFRLIIKPDLWGRQMRFRFSNAFGTKPVVFDTAFAGLQMSGAAVVRAPTGRLPSAARNPSPCRPAPRSGRMRSRCPSCMTRRRWIWPAASLPSPSTSRR